MKNIIDIPLRKILCIYRIFYLYEILNRLRENKKKRQLSFENCRFSFGGEMGIRTPDTVVAVYTISNRAPSTSSDISPFIRSNTKNKY